MDTNSMERQIPQFFCPLCGNIATRKGNGLFQCNVRVGFRIGDRAFLPIGDPCNAMFRVIVTQNTINDQEMISFAFTCYWNELEKWEPLRAQVLN